MIDRLVTAGESQQVGRYDHLLTQPPSPLTSAEKMRIAEALHAQGVRMMRDKLAKSGLAGAALEDALAAWLSPPVVLDEGLRLK